MKVPVKIVTNLFYFLPQCECVSFSCCRLRYDVSTAATAAAVAAAVVVVVDFFLRWLN